MIHKADSRRFQAQTFLDGLVSIYRVVNEGGAGNHPKYRLKAAVQLPYNEQQVGDVRFYAAMQADETITKVIRVPKINNLQPAGDVAVFSGSTLQYEVIRVAVNTHTRPESMDVTLKVSSKQYDIGDWSNT